MKARDKQLRSYITGMMCGFIALSVHSSFDFDLVYASMALLFWTMFAVSAAESSDGVVQESAVAGDAGSGETVRGTDPKARQWCGGIVIYCSRSDRRLAHPFSDLPGFL